MVTNSRQQVIYYLIKHLQFHEGIVPEDLSIEYASEFNPYLVLLALQTPPKDADQEKYYLKLLVFMLERSKPEQLIEICSSLFSWLSRVLLKSSPAAFDYISHWFETNHTEKKSLLASELESRAKGKNILSELIEEKRLEIVWKIKETSSNELWMQLISDRSTVGNKVEYDVWDIDNKKKRDDIVSEYLPFFAALKANQIELCKSLVPKGDQLQSITQFEL